MLESDSPPLEIASSVLEARFGTRPKLAIEERFVTGKSISARCRVTGLADIDAVFVKHLPPEKQSDQTLNDFLWEIASYQAISQIPEAIQITPAFFGFDREERCLVLEDLGAPAGPNTADLLQGSDPDAAMEALLEGVRLLGRFHGACASIALKMSSIRAELGPSVPVRHPFEDPWPRVGFVASSEVEVSRAVAEYRDVCLFCGVTPALGVEDEIEQVAARVEADPGDWLTLCRGDQNMAGDFIRTVSGPRLYDFDAAGPRHALLEGMPGRLTWGCMMRIPEAAIAPMEEAYRSELSQFIPVAANLRAYQIGMADAGARWHIFHVLSRLSEALKLERPRGPSSLRQQTIAWLRAFVRLTDDVGGYPALGSTAKGLVETVTKLWTDEQTELPWYPAFAVTST